MSWMPTTSPVASASSVASMRHFSVNGSPICTAGRSASDPSESSREAKLAPPKPSRPVEEPTYSTGLPTPRARARAMSLARTMPRHMTLTMGFSRYVSSKTISPPTVGTPMQLP